MIFLLTYYRQCAQHLSFVPRQRTGSYVVHGFEATFLIFAKATEVQSGDWIGIPIIVEWSRACRLVQTVHNF